MAVTHVASTPFQGEPTSTLTTYLPSGLSTGDWAFLFIFHPGTCTPPSGIDFIASRACTDGTLTYTLSVYRRVCDSDDSDSTWAFTLSTSDMVWWAGSTFRGADNYASGTAFVSSTATYQITPASLTGDGAGQMLCVAAGTINFSGDAETPTLQTSFTRTSGAGEIDYALAAGYRAIGNSDSNSGAVDLSPGDTAPTNGLAAVTLRLYSSAGTPTVDVRLQVLSPLGSASLRSAVVNAARSAAPSPLGTVKALGLFDLSPFLVDVPPSRFVMDLVTPDGLVRVPISSWQASLQIGSSQYVQCVVPAPSPYLDQLTAATEFRISALVKMKTGETIEYVFAYAPIDQASYAKGSENWSVTLSGYQPSADESIVWPATTDRPLKGVSVVFQAPSGLRVRCSVDWALRPGQRALLDGVPFTVRYINYTIPADGQQSMEVGELVETL